jgi:hypothetical protein
VTFLKFAKFGHSYKEGGQRHNLQFLLIQIKKINVADFKEHGGSGKCELFEIKIHTSLGFSAVNPQEPP